MNKYWYDQICADCPLCGWYVRTWTDVCLRYGYALNDRHGVAPSCDGFQTEAEIAAEKRQMELAKKRKR